MTGLSITDIILGGVALASLAWMFRHLVLKTDRSVDSLTSKQEEFASTQGKHVERLAVMDTKVEQHGEQIQLLRKDVKHRLDKVDDRFDKMDDRIQKVDEKMSAGFAEVNNRFTRVDAKMNAGFTEVNNRFTRVDAKMNAGFAEVNNRFRKVDDRLDKVDDRLDKIDDRLDKIDDRLDKVDKKFDNTNARMDKGFAEVRELLFRFLAPDQEAPQPSNPVPSSAESAKAGSSVLPS